MVHVLNYLLSSLCRILFSGQVKFFMNSSLVKGQLSNFAISTPLAYLDLFDLVSSFDLVMQ